MKQKFIAFPEAVSNPAKRCGPRVFSPCGVLAFEAEIVRDHRDKFTIRRFSLDAADGVAEEPLQGLHVAAVPGHLNGVADFGTFVPKVRACSTLSKSVNFINALLLYLLV